MSDHINLLRFALAAIWTELEADTPSLDNAQKIADEALFITKAAAKSKDLTNQETGIESWRIYLAKREERIIKNEIFVEGAKSHHSDICGKTKRRVGSDQWWLEYQENKCNCHACSYWCEHHNMDKRISWDDLNELTMHVALLLGKLGIDGYQYSECLNILKGSLQKSLEMNGLNYDPMLGGGNWSKTREKVENEKRSS